MSKVKQSPNGRGSLKCIQDLVNENPEYINSIITNHFAELATENVIWLSPLKSDDFAEYKDYSFLNLVGANSINVELKDFWQKGGSIAQIYKIVLVRIAELHSVPTKGIRQNTSKKAKIPITWLNGKLVLYLRVLVNPLTWIFLLSIANKRFEIE